MDPLVQKIDRLSAEQRREVEDFVDFLIQRAEGISVTVRRDPQSPPTVKRTPPPPFLPTEQGPGEGDTSGQHDKDQAPEGNAAGSEAEEHLINEISGGDDLLTRDYMDYGMFERHEPDPSPAGEAVARVRAKPGKKARREKTGAPLDWID